MKLQSCQNCWHNGLQYGSVGLPFGYCARHAKILNFADETTCGQQIRKDLGLARAHEVAARHSQLYDDDIIVRLTTKEQFDSDTSDAGIDEDLLRKDRIADAVIDYGFLNSKIASLAQLKSISSARADVALTSLGRAYVRNCIARGGTWTSGIHIFWWTRSKVAEIPTLEISDLRYPQSVSVSRQANLSVWSVMMLRLSLLDDITIYASSQGDDVGQVDNIASSAAGAVQDFSLRKLSAWITRALLPALDAKLDATRYRAIASELHKADDRDSN